MSTEQITLAGRYVLESRIARGGMGTVWRASDEVLARTVAVKLLHPSLSNNQQFIERFRREAFAAARLTHPNIVSIYDTGHEESFGDSRRHYIVMEYCGGGTVKDVLDRRGSLEPQEAVEIGARVCDALGYAHRNGVVHRDIKPENVLVAEDGSLKVADFGIAKAAFALGDLTTTGVILGTVTHISPEQARGEEPDARSDLYSVGILVYELLTGRPPFRAESEIGTAMQHVHDPPPPLRSFKPGIPRQIESAVLQALQKDPQDRYGSADEMRRALESAGGETPTRALRATKPVPAVASQAPGAVAGDRRSPASRLAVAALILVGLSVLAALLIPTLVDRVPSGSRPDRGGDRQRRSGRALAPIPVRAVNDFDPFGDDGEHPEEAELAADGNRASSWTTESYDGPLTALKPGVGLVFDLGPGTEVTRVVVASSQPGHGFVLKQSDVIAGDDSGFSNVARVDDAPATARLMIEPTQARYWLIWITSLPGGGGGSASISEVKFFGP